MVVRWPHHKDGVPESPSAVARVYRFSVFELDTGAGELRRSGVRLNLPDQPFQLLLALLEKEGQIVTREDLQQRLWNRDTFVDFNAGLNAAVKRLRDVLGDSADTPRFVETVQRRGYRWIGPLQPNPSPTPAAVPPPAKLRRQWLWIAAAGEPVYAHTRSTLTIAAIVGAVALTAVVGALLTVSARDNALRRQPTAASPIHRQLTFVGNVSDAALSPDGRTFAYTSEGRLLIQEVSGGTPAEIVRADVVSEEMSTLRWSPGGDRLVFMSYDQHWNVLNVVSSHGGRPVNLTGMTPFTYSAWSPDGSRLAVASQHDPGRFEIIDATDGRSIGSVSLPGFQSGQDISWHPKLDRLAVLERHIPDQWVIWLATPDGREARPVYTDVQTITSICWSPIENRLYFLRIQNEAAELAALDFADTPPTARVLISGLPAGGRLTISGDGQSLLHVRSTATANLARLDLTASDEPMQFITNGTRRFSSPRVSPDGHWIAAVVGIPPRTRIVKLPFAGGEPMPLTSGENLDGAPAWSPDGTRIAFGSVRGGTAGVWLMRADGQQLEQVRNSAPTNLLTAWAPDGRLMWQEFTGAGGMNYRIRDLSSGHDSFLFPGLGDEAVFLPEFAPSGKEFAIFWNRGGRQRGLYVVSWPALAPRLLTHYTYWPVGWSADGASVIASGERDVWLVSTRDGESKRLTRLLLSSDDKGDVTPDGKYFVSSVAGGTADAWLIQNFDPQAPTHR